MAGTQLFDLAETGAQRVVLRQGEVIVEAGHEGLHLYRLISGRVLVLRAGVAVAEVAEGSWFGELAVLTGAPRSATVVAAEDARLWVLPGHTVAALLESSPPLVISLLRQLATDLHEARAQGWPEALWARPRQGSQCAAAKRAPEGGS